MSYHAHDPPPSLPLLFLFKIENTFVPQFKERGGYSPAGLETFAGATIIYIEKRHLPYFYFFNLMGKGVGLSARQAKHGKAPNDSSCCYLQIVL